MSEKKRVVEALKHRMKTQGITYATMAKRIGVSEATMKRYLTQGRFNLETLENMCGALHASLEELLIAYGEHAATENRSHFSEQQEEALAKSDLLFAIYYSLGGGYNFESLQENFDISETVLIKLLVQLDRLGLVDYVANDKIRLKQPTDAQWIPSGPLWAKYQRQAVLEFFSSDFSGENEHLQVTVGPVLPETATVIARKLGRLNKEIQNYIATEDISPEAIPACDRYWFMTAMRPMSFSALSKRVVDAALKALSGKR